ncbi:MAG: 3-phosphoshikimate 1-carboxyvinyltransferase [Clostridia bacterium]|nr:3-phosphoshikimate 1-carboxyvinyltransferase [Clostridia bacterium]
MRINIEKSTAKGVIKAPPSKSDAHRLLICAGLANGKSTVHNIALSEDISATIDCLRSLGAKIEIFGDSVTVEGITAFDSERFLDCRESGSTLRFFIPICMLSKDKTQLVGSERLFSRPLDVYQKMCERQKLTFEQNGASVTVAGRLKSGEYSVNGNISSQFISGLLFALPMLDGDSIIRIIPPVESRPYIEMTLNTLRKFNVSCEWQDSETLFIKGGQRYCPQNVTAEGDWSNAAFLDGFGIIGSFVTATGLYTDSLQGDKIYKEYFKSIKDGTPTLDITNCPDLGPVLMALAAANNGAVLTGTKRLKIKESDRGEAMKEELSKFNVSVTVNEDEIIVGCGLSKPTQVLCSHNDHRIVMSLALLLTLTGGSIDGAEAVKKSFPDFFETIRKLGIVWSEG